MKIIPLNNYIIIEKEEIEETKLGGILIIPDSVKEQEKAQKSEGIVYAKNKDSIVNTGDHVVYKRWAADEFKFEGKEYYFVTDDDLMALIK
jgi:chaperonin GroES